MIKDFAMTLSFTGKFGISGAWMAACLFTPEIYPTNIRFIPKFITSLDMTISHYNVYFYKAKATKYPQIIEVKIFFFKFRGGGGCREFFVLIRLI